MSRSKFLLLAVCGAGFFACQSYASELWSSNFIITSGIFDGTQFQTNNPLVYNATVQGWSSSGFHAAHSVEVGTNDWALMVFSAGGADANLYTLNTGFAANTAGTNYWVSYQIAPTVYQAAGQQTGASNVLRVSVLNPADQTVATTLVSPGAWDSTQTFQQKYFSYVGNGTGDVRLQITSGDAGTGVFDGAIHEIAFWDTQPNFTSVPEPASYTLMGFGILAVAWKRRH